MANEYINLQTAAIDLKISKSELLLMIKDGILKTYDNPLDKDERLVLKADIERLKNPQPSTEAPLLPTKQSLEIPIDEYIPPFDRGANRV